MLSHTNRITIHPDICNGRSIIASTRITVQTVMEFFGAGDSIEEVLGEYPCEKSRTNGLLGDRRLLRLN